MLLFRDEEHVRRWCEQWRMSPGALLPLDQAWQLAVAWFSADRGATEWQRPPIDQVESLFATLGLTDKFWSLR